MNVCLYKVKAAEYVVNFILVVTVAMVCVYTCARVAKSVVNFNSCCNSGNSVCVCVCVCFYRVALNSGLLLSFPAVTRPVHTHTHKHTQH